MKQIKLKDRIEIIKSCYLDCPCYNEEYYCCNIDNDIGYIDESSISEYCPLEDYKK